MTTQPPLARRDAAFLRQLANFAGSPLDAKAIYRTQHALPWLPTGRIAEAVERIWIVPSVTVEGRRYHVALDTGECHYAVGGYKRPCPDRTYNKPQCCHYQAAEHAELNMFGGSAAEYFAPTVEEREVA